MDREQCDAWLARMQSGDRRALARLMTLVESRAPLTGYVMERAHAAAGRARLIGITGPPGAGKSTLVDRLVGALRTAGHRIGIVAVDPSSPFSGGAVLGDRIRMQGHFLDEEVFIRSLSARGHMGGLARATRDVCRLLEAAGKDVVIIETVGVGQSEFDILRVAESVVVVLVPEAGDTVQAMKAGLLEIADVFVVNKADRPGADHVQADLRSMLELQSPADGWTVPVVPTVATDGTGLDALVEALDAHAAHLASSGAGAARAAAGRRQELLGLLADELVGRVQREAAAPRHRDLMEAVEAGRRDPYSAARELLDDPEWRAAVAAGERRGT